MIQWASIPNYKGSACFIVSTQLYNSTIEAGRRFATAADAVAFIRERLGVSSFGHTYLPYYTDYDTDDVNALIVLEEIAAAANLPLANQLIVTNMAPATSYRHGTGVTLGTLEAAAGAISNYERTIISPYAFTQYGRNQYINADRVRVTIDISVIPAEAYVNGKINTANMSQYHTLRVNFDYDGRENEQSRYGAGISSLKGAKTATFMDGAEGYSNPQDNDPYTSAGYPESTAPGGYTQGDLDFEEDGETDVHDPSLDLLNCGLITAWRPTKAILSQLAGWLWITTPGQIIQQLFGNPINAIIGLNVVPVSPPVDGGTNTIKFGAEDSGVACPKITDQHVTVDCGTLKIAPKYGSYMDYAPQTSAELFLPYVGGLPLDVNDVINKTIRVKYKVDVLSGACVAYVFIDGVLHYQKAGGCAATAPITGAQMPNVVSGVLSIIGSVAGAVASMGASGAGTAAKVASGIATGTSIAESTANMLKQSISYAGTISGWAGHLGSQKPYLILTMPNAAVPGAQNTLMGYPAWVSGSVGDFHGYTECVVDRIHAYRATDQEVEEIKALLAGGVVL